MALQHLLNISIADTKKPNEKETKATRTHPSNDWQNTLSFTPEPAYVVKTLTVSKTAGFPQGLKFFLNICHSSQIPAPSSFEDVRNRIVHGDEWDITVLGSEVRFDVDKAGKKSAVVDCCVNSRVLHLGLSDEVIRAYIIETSVEMVENKAGAVLSREFSMPKMVSKGELQKVQTGGKSAPAINFVQEFSSAKMNSNDDDRARDEKENNTQNVRFRPATEESFLSELSTRRLR